MDKSAVQEAVMEQLEILLRSEGISKAELARRSGLPPRTVENYFKGNAPSIEALFSLARGNGVAVDWLLAPLSEGKETSEITVSDSEHAFIMEGAKDVLKCVTDIDTESVTLELTGETVTRPVTDLAWYIANNVSQKLEAARKAGYLNPEEP